MKLIKKIDKGERWGNGKPKPYGLFQCECGAMVERLLYVGLKNKSCGCKKPAPKGKKNWKYRHGACGSALYWVWHGMKGRCKKQNRQSANVIRNYNDREISVCDDWKTAANFIAWAKSSGYRPGLFLDRKDNDKGYNPENCRWVTPKKSAQNRRIVAACKVIALQLVALVESGLSIKAASESLGVNYDRAQWMVRKYRKK